MMLRRLVPVFGFLAVVLLPTAAMAKGVESAVISGPGISGPDGSGSDSRGSGSKTISGDPNLFAEELGGYAGVFGDSLFDEPPEGALGPRYTVTYVFISEPHNRRITQDVYPYAPNGTVTHMAAGQKLPFEEGTTQGGWFLAGQVGFDRLVAQGLPPKNPELVATTNAGGEAAASSDFNPWLSAILIAIAASALGAAVFWRTRPRAARPA